MTPLTPSPVLPEIQHHIREGRRTTQDAHSPTEEAEGIREAIPALGRHARNPRLELSERYQVLVESRFSMPDFGICPSSEVADFVQHEETRRDSGRYFREQQRHGEVGSTGTRANATRREPRCAW